MTKDAYFVDQPQRGTDLYRPAYGKKRLRKEKTHYVVCRGLLFSELNRGFVWLELQTSSYSQ